MSIPSQKYFQFGHGIDVFKALEHIYAILSVRDLKHVPLCARITLDSHYIYTDLAKQEILEGILKHYYSGRYSVHPTI